MLDADLFGGIDKRLALFGFLFLSGSCICHEECSVDAVECDLERCLVKEIGLEGFGTLVGELFRRSRVRVTGDESELEIWDGGLLFEQGSDCFAALLSGRADNENGWHGD